MENYTQERVDEMCTMHEAWLKDRSAGKRADFSGASLQGLVLEGRCLREANFKDADLSFEEAHLWRADFVDAVTGGVSFAGANMEFAAFNSGIAGDSYDDKQIAEFAYSLCSAVLGSRTNSSEVKETIRKILSLANRANSVKVFGPVQENIRGKYFTAKEKAE